MKTLAKIFTAVVAGVLAFSCVTDTTEDLGVNLGEGQTTTIGISLEDSRTHITGVPDAEGKYLMYWSEDDKIAVNGKASEPLKGLPEEGTQSATFKVNAVLDYPYEIVYPAPAEGVKAQAEGCQVVTFPSVQAHNANSFAEGAVPMYGYVANESAFTQLNHLAGVLRFLVQCGEGVENTTLKSMVVEVNHGSIAGNFDVDCATGDLTAHADALNTVTVSFGEAGLAVTAEPTPVYVSVPAGEYGTVSVTLYTDNSSFTAKFGTYKNSEEDNNSIKAGKVREFSTPIVYVPSAVSDTFLIYDEASLRNFASRVSEADFATTYPTATVVANIDLTGKEWTPIEGYTGTFDGLNHKIIGLSAPLFGTTSATISNVNLDVNIVETASQYFGCLVCSYQGSAISNCSVSGQMVVNGDKAYYIGGIVGYTPVACSYSNLTNKVAIYIEDKTGTELNSFIAGCFGAFSRVKATISNCSNSGDITLAENHTLSIGTKNLYIGGILGYSYSVTISDVVNSGHININGEISTARLLIGGIAGDWRMDSDLTNATNYGNIVFGEGSSTTITANYFSPIGGIAGMAYPGSKTAKNCVNYGNIDIKDGATLTTPSEFRIGGCFGHAEQGTIENIVNEGSITISGACQGLCIGGCCAYNNKATNSDTTIGYINNGKIELTNSANTTDLKLGGCVGSKGKSNLSNCTNNKDISIDGTHSGSIRIGGILGYAPTNSITLTNIINKGNIVVETNANLADGHMIGGLVGELSQALVSCVNTGNIDIKVAGQANNTNYVGGCVAKIGSAHTKRDLRTFGNIKAIGYTNVGMLTGSPCDGTIVTASAYDNFYYGGSIWTSSEATDYTPLTIDNYLNFAHNHEPADEATKKTFVETYKYGWLDNSVDDAPQYAFAETTKIGTADELIAWAATAASETNNVEITADIDLTGETWTPIEGFAGYMFNGGGKKIKGLTAPLFGATTTSFITNVHLEFDEMKYYDQTIHQISGKDWVVMGALVCFLNNTSAIISNCSVSGTINIPDGMAKLGYIGGIVGYTTSTQKFSHIVSKADINVSGNIQNSQYIAGCVSYTAGSLDNCQNLGNISVNPTSSATYEFTVSGITALSGDITNCINGSDKDGEIGKYGNITISGTLNKTNYFGGISSRQATNIKNSHNYGNINVGGEQKNTAGSVNVAGIFGLPSKLVSVDNCENHGNIKLTMTTKTNNAFVAGIGCEVASDGFTLNNVKNYGNVTYEGNAGGSIYVSGIINVSKDDISLHKGYNYGNITANGTIAKELHIGGIIGRHNGIKMFSGDIINEGIILVDKNTNVTGSAYIGGLFGGCNTEGGTIEGGNIYSRGPIIVEKDAKAANMYIGGVIGSLAEATSHNPKIIGVKSACEILADGRSNIGMIIGTERDASNPLVYDCRVGGLFWKSNSAQGEAEAYSPEMLDATNHHKYIYGSGRDTNWTGAIRYDGNIYDSSLEAIPTPNKYTGLEE